MSPHSAQTALQKQSAILAYIKQTFEHDGFSPTILEIQRACNLSTKSLVVYHLNALVRQGKITILTGLARGIRLSK